MNMYQIPYFDGMAFSGYPYHYPAECFVAMNEADDSSVNAQAAQARSVGESLEPDDDVKQDFPTLTLGERTRIREKVARAKNALTHT